MFTKNQLGILYMLLAVCTFSVMDLLVKWSSEYPTGEVLFFRGFFGLLPTFFLIPKNKLKTFYKTNRPKEHLFRCLMGLIALVAIVIALRKLPLAVVVSLSFAAPLFITVLSIFLLSEKVGLFRWGAVLIGFIGVIVISEPGFDQMNIYYLLPLIFCIGMAFVTITIRKLSTSEPIWLISIFFTITISIAGLFTISMGWKMPDLKDFILLALIGVTGGSANLFLTQSYKLSEVSLVAPLKYLSLVFAVIFGYLIWNEVPTFKTLIGASLVIFASLIIFRREIYHKEKIPSTTRHE
ncbi:MAG: DMT family transporter [Pelagibacteraceae bacterium]|jgi:drug/metabolite transporter (DMT)-like permease|nr:DMT family transporter [Pelagibacteraceae bacterium]MBT3600080.1 DMT family transporter [Candidatus Pelagibacter sp.]MBT3693893.1 DMT family transporter [Candidatus Pelagibacter sp.]MDC0427591.1 DMT family transporter [Candidatus Pelagibacter sp.]MDC0448617.1 DMT family transporter [Candidatus Pelagibacter sp.]